VGPQNGEVLPYTTNIEENKKPPINHHTWWSRNLDKTLHPPKTYIIIGKLKVSNIFLT